MDCAGFPTISYHKLVAGSDELFAVRWYRCQDGAQQLGVNTFVVLERLWDSDYFATGKFSKATRDCEPRGLNRDWCPLQPFPGTDPPLGDPAWYRDGVPADLVGPPLEECCDCLGARRNTSDL